MRGVILIPYRPSDERRQLWDWASYFLADIGWEIFTGDDGREPFSRAAAMNKAAKKAGKWNVALLGDADTVQEANPCWAAAEKVRDVGAIVPWRYRRKLSQAGTWRFIMRGPEEFTERDCDRSDHSRGGGTIMVSRKAWDTVGGMDERFRGYGNEDLAFRIALETLVGPITDVEGTHWHLYHRPARFVGTDRAATPENRERLERYRRAAGNADAVRGLLDAA